VFIGFEATAIYSEEAREPRKTIPRAAYVAIAVVAVFHVVTAWSVVLHYGPSNVQDAALADPGNFVYNVADATIGGAYVDVMKVLFITSTFAACLGVHNALSRYQYSLARDGLLPKALSHTHPVWKSPHKSSLSQTVFAIAAIVVLWAFGVEPMTVFALLMAVGAFGLITLMAALCVAVVYFFIRDRRDESHWSRLIAPAIAGVGFITVIVLLLENWDIQTGSTGWVAQNLPWAIPSLAIIGFLVPGRADDPEPSRSADRADEPEQPAPPAGS
jgi:amino acid transporter